MSADNRIIFVYSSILNAMDHNSEVCLYDFKNRGTFRRSKNEVPLIVQDLEKALLNYSQFFLERSWCAL